MEVQTGIPTLPGVYVVWIDDVHVRNPKYTKRYLMDYNDGWFYPHSDQKLRGPIYQWLGPLPALKAPA